MLIERRAKPWSATVYALLVELYPRAFLRRHRAELMQNFDDLERAQPRKIMLWLFIANDLAISLVSARRQEMKSLNSLTAYVVGVLIAWAAIFAAGYVFHGSTPGHPVLHVFFGFLLGMLSMYIATRVYTSRRDGQGV